MENSEFSLVEKVFILVPILFLDLLEVLVGFTFLGMALVFVDMAVWFFFTIVLLMKGGFGRDISTRIAAWTVADIAELAPGLEILPIRTITTALIIRGWNKKIESKKTKSDKKKRLWFVGPKEPAPQTA